jgi:hypothetical protein
MRRRGIVRRNVKYDEGEELGWCAADSPGPSTVAVAFNRHSLGPCFSHHPDDHGIDLNTTTVQIVH